MLIIGIVIVYFYLLFGISRWTGRKATNDTFYRGNRQSPWYMVAFGMIGASISGVTFVSVPGMVNSIDMTYLQTCLGFILGYVVVAFVLLPLFYRLNLTTIYSYLGQRLGPRSYKTGASFFLLSKMTGAAVRFYVVCIILQHFVFDALGIPFVFTVLGMVLLIWLYTYQGGIRTLVFTDVLQTIFLFTALLLIIWQVIGDLGLTWGEAFHAVASDSRSRIFVFDDWVTKQNFWKQFLSGVFIVIVMTGLDQDMMQKNLTCRSLQDAQKDMCTYGVMFFPANLLFLSLGILLTQWYTAHGIALPAAGDELLPTFVSQTSSLLPLTSSIFVLGILAASFSSADSAMTALTTSFCVDICQRPDDETLRKKAHILVAVVFTIFILLFRILNSTSIIDAIYILCSYTYGPLLGLFAFGLLTKRKTNDRLVPYICIVSPVLCYLLDWFVGTYTGYHFGYELLMLNGVITFTALFFVHKEKD
ncbi:MAG: sodium:solute symporter [Prevotella sp.]|nr:sodium:solute symporter [Prevotella sp.]